MSVSDPLWPSGQSSWLQIQRSEFDYRRYQIFWEVVGLERGPLSLVSTIEELLERKSIASGLENRNYGIGDPPRYYATPVYQQKLALTSQGNGGCSVGIARSRTKCTKLLLLVIMSVSIFLYVFWIQYVCVPMCVKFWIEYVCVCISVCMFWIECICVRISAYVLGWACLYLSASMFWNKYVRV
jgi:hypothetical protein